MAFGKTVVEVTGVTTEYHRIVSVDVNFAQVATRAYLASYVSAAVRETDPGNALVVKTEALELSGVPSGSETIREWCYQQIKAQHPDWQDATDI